MNGKTQRKVFLGTSDGKVYVFFDGSEKRFVRDRDYMLACFDFASIESPEKFMDSLDRLGIGDAVFHDSFEWKDPRTIEETKPDELLSCFDNALTPNVCVDMFDEQQRKDYRSKLRTQTRRKHAKRVIDEYGIHRLNENKQIARAGIPSFALLDLVALAHDLKMLCALYLYGFAPDRCQKEILMHIATVGSMSGFHFCEHGFQRTYPDYFNFLSQDFIANGITTTLFGRMAEWEHAFSTRSPKTSVGDLKEMCRQGGFHLSSPFNPCANDSWYDNQALARKASCLGFNIFLGRTATHFDENGILNPLQPFDALTAIFSYFAEHLPNGDVAVCPWCGNVFGTGERKTKKNCTKSHKEDYSRYKTNTERP